MLPDVSVCWIFWLAYSYIHLRSTYSMLVLVCVCNTSQPLVVPQPSNEPRAIRTTVLLHTQIHHALWVTSQCKTPFALCPQDTICSVSARHPLLCVRKTPFALCPQDTICSVSARCTTHTGIIYFMHAYVRRYSACVYSRNVCAPIIRTATTRAQRCRKTGAFVHKSVKQSKQTTLLFGRRFEVNHATSEGIVAQHSAGY